MPHAIPQNIVSEYNLNIYTTWTKWSLCSNCNVVGKKVRYGYCTVSSRADINKKNIIEEKLLANYKRQSILFFCAIFIYLYLSYHYLIISIIYLKISKCVTFSCRE